MWLTLRFNFKNEVKMKRIINVLFLFLCFSTEIFARAGGGSGGGGRFSALGYAISLIMTLIILILVYIRTKESKKQILISGKIDPIWNYEKLCDYAKNSFMRMQDAWMQKNLDLVSDLITENCKADLTPKLKHLDFVNEKNVMEDIRLKKIKIIGCEDYLDNEKDAFVAYIYGSMIDYTLSGFSGRVTQNTEKKRNNFCDLYYFHRYNDIWLLDKITNEVGISKVYNAKHILEKSDS